MIVFHFASDPHYLSPKSINDCYKICPAPRPVVIPVTPSPTTETPPSPLCGYLAMNSTPQIKIDVQKEKKMPSSSSKTKCSQESINNTHSRAASPILQSGHKVNKTKNLPIYEDKFQKELLEIINDFKNNVHSIAQAEKLVEEWKNRNDVQKSFKEKREQLDELRMKYEKIQQEMKRNHKVTPFERIKKLFAWGNKHKDEEHKYEVTVPTTEACSVSNNRPISSLSLQSTSSKYHLNLLFFVPLEFPPLLNKLGVILFILFFFFLTGSGSSGRTSTISGCSVGDSGTHSDHDERKVITFN